MSIRHPDPMVVSINVSEGGIPKLPVESIFVGQAGLQRDGHHHEKHRRPEQAVCLQDIEKLEEMSALGYALGPGTTGENLTVRNLDVNNLPLGTILEFSSGLRIELTKVRKPCYVLDQIHPQLKVDILGRCGAYARVLQEGFVHVHDPIRVVKPDLTPLSV
jgi:MOSC domain-containing protein YiiM